MKLCNTLSGQMLLILDCKIDESHLEKDMFLLMNYLSKRMNLTANIVYPGTNENKNLPDRIHNVNLIRIECLNSFLLFKLRAILYLLLHANKYSIMVKYYFNIRVGIYALIYKFIMPNGLFYLKADGKVCIPARQRDDNVLIYNIKLYLWNKGLKLTDVISTETIYNYNLSINTNKNNSDFISKFIIVPNGFDAYTLDQFNLPELKLEEKDNIIIFVGKVGSYFKNNELILSALEKIDFKSDWKFYFIGPVEDHFEEKVKAIFIKHPNLKDRIKLIGPIFDKKELWDYYRHAKVFVLSSISESYALVLNEAFKFNNYIVSTPVGVAPELVQYGYGELYEHNNAEQLASILQKIINDTSYLQDRYNQCQIDTKVNDWSIIIDNLIAKFQEIKTYDKFTHNKKF